MNHFQISGITTIIKSAWWYWFFRIPKESRKNNPVPVSHTVNNADSGESCALQIPQKQVILPNVAATSTAEDVINIEPTSATPPEGCDQIRIDLETDAISETYSIGNELSDSNADSKLVIVVVQVMSTNGPIICRRFVDNYRIYHGVRKYRSRTFFTTRPSKCELRLYCGVVLIFSFILPFGLCPLYISVETLHKQGTF